MSGKFSPLAVFGVMMMGVSLGCDGVAIPNLDDLGDIIDIIDGNGNDNGADTFVASVAFATFATNTGGGTGIALHPETGELYMVNTDGLFGPISQDDDISLMDPIGATNLNTPELFDPEAQTSNLVLAITNSGEFWIGSGCCNKLAIVPADGGDAEPFDGLIVGGSDTTIRAETMVIVPDGFTGAQIMPGMLLVGADNDFSRLAAIDVENDRSVIAIDNPTITAEEPRGINRDAHHLTFGLDGVLYGVGKDVGQTTIGFQAIGTDGSPEPIEGTLALEGDTFVALENGDFIIDGLQVTSATSNNSGILIYEAATETVIFALDLAGTERSADDEMIISPDGSTIYLSLPLRNEIVTVRRID